MVAVKTIILGAMLAQSADIVARTAVLGGGRCQVLRCRGTSRRKLRDSFHQTAGQEGDDDEGKKEAQHNFILSLQTGKNFTTKYFTCRL
jgi:hypothetical protein